VTTVTLGNYSKNTNQDVRITGVLEDIGVGGFEGGGFYVSGDISGDCMKRFPDGDRIRTSLVRRVLVETVNSVFELDANEVMEMLARRTADRMVEKLDALKNDGTPKA
jgi:hypothetical protein